MFCRLCVGRTDARKKESRIISAPKHNFRSGTHNRSVWLVPADGSSAMEVASHHPHSSGQDLIGQRLQLHAGVLKPVNFSSPFGL
jgi:hypothetical protein